MPSFDLNDFITATAGGLARPSKFNITLTVTSAMGSVNIGSSTNVTFLAKASSIPAFTLGEVPVGYFGRKIKLAGDRTWEDWHLTVMLDEAYTTRALFETWSNGINRIESNVMDSNFDNSGYKTTWLIDHYGMDGSIIREYQIIGGWPRTVGPVTMDWDGTDRISQFDVTVAFDNFFPTSGGELGASGSTYFNNVDTAGANQPS